MFMVLSSCLRHCESSPWSMVHAMSAARRKVDADLWTKPIGFYHLCPPVGCQLTTGCAKLSDTTLHFCL